MVVEFEENNLMTCVQGVWIKRVKAVEVDKLKKEKRKEIKAERGDSEKDKEAEKIKLKELLKPELLKLHNQLVSQIAKNGKSKLKRLENPRKDILKRNKTSGRRRKQLKLEQLKEAKNERRLAKSSKYDIVTDRDKNFKKKAYSIEKVGKYVTDESMPGMVRFEGIWILEESAKRCKEMREKMEQEGHSRAEIDETIKKERRRAENYETRKRNTTCFSCRKTGHRIADCPDKVKTQGVGVCFKCGSADHTQDLCMSGNTTQTHAHCFICSEKGHLARECPKNEKGLYPKGGGCTICDSNKHLVKDCPRNWNKPVPTEVRAKRMVPGGHLEDQPEPQAPPPNPKTAKKKRKVKF